MLGPGADPHVSMWGQTHPLDLNLLLKPQSKFYLYFENLHKNPASAPQNPHENPEFVPKTHLPVWAHTPQMKILGLPLAGCKQSKPTSMGHVGMHTN